MSRRPSSQTLALLAALAAEPASWRYGYDLAQQVGVKTGTLYPILMRLSDRGLLEHTWQTDPPPGRPPRHMYRLTAAGVRYAAEQVTPTATRPSPRLATGELGGAR